MQEYELHFTINYFDKNSKVYRNIVFSEYLPMFGSSKDHITYLERIPNYDSLLLNPVPELWQVLPAMLPLFVLL